MAKPVHKLDAAYVIGINNAFSQLFDGGNETDESLKHIANAFCDPGLIPLHRAWEDAYAKYQLSEVTGESDIDLSREAERRIRKELLERVGRYRAEYKQLMHGAIEGDIEFPN